MSDLQSIGAIADLEQQIMALQSQVKELRAGNEKWVPKASSSVEPDGSCKVTLHFGGKAITATMSTTYLATVDVTSATTSITETLCSSLVVDRLKEVVQPEVERLIKNSVSLQSTGKW